MNILDRDETEAEIEIGENMFQQMMKWKISPYQRQMMFRSYKITMVATFRAADVSKLISGEWSKPLVPPVGGAAILALHELHKKLYKIKDELIWTLLQKSFTDENYGFVDSSEIEDGNGVLLWDHLVSFNEKTTTDLIDDNREQFSKTAQNIDEPLVALIARVRDHKNILTRNDHPIRDKIANNVIRTALINTELGNQLILSANSQTFVEFCKTVLLLETKTIKQKQPTTQPITQDLRKQKADDLLDTIPCNYCLMETGQSNDHPARECRRKKPKFACFVCGDETHKASDCPKGGKGQYSGKGYNSGRGGRGYQGGKGGYEYSANSGGYQSRGRGGQQSTGRGYQTNDSYYGRNSEDSSNNYNGSEDDKHDYTGDQRGMARSARGRGSSAGKGANHSYHINIPPPPTPPPPSTIIFQDLPAAEEWEWDPQQNYNGMITDNTDQPPRLIATYVDDFIVATANSLTNSNHTPGPVTIPGRHLIYDAACQINISCDKNKFTTFTATSDHVMLTADGTPMPVEGYGDAYGMKKTFLIPSCKQSLFSNIQAHLEGGWTTHHSPCGTTITKTNTNTTPHTVYKFLFNGEFWVMDSTCDPTPTI